MKIFNPNILLITTDQHRLDSIGCYGNPDIRTPHLDSIASEGFRVDNMFVAAPVCAPNRASLVTGRMPSVHGVRVNGIPLPKKELTLMEYLRRNNYQTFAAGKMHFGPQWHFPPEGQTMVDPDPNLGIDPQPSEDSFPWYGLEQARLTEDHRIGPYGDYLKSHGFDVLTENHSANYPQSSLTPSPFPRQLHQSAWITDEALSFLENRENERPFFLWASYVHPHHPFNPPRPYDTLYNPSEMPLPKQNPHEYGQWPEAYIIKREAHGDGHEAVGMSKFTSRNWQEIKANYYGMISDIDDHLGRLFQELKMKGLWDDTVVLFTSDHGELLGDHGLLFKGAFWDCITRVPCIVKPALSSPVEGGPDRFGFSSTLDIFPTLLHLANIDSPRPNPIQGRSLFSNSCGLPRQRRSFVLIEDGERRALRTEEALFVWHGRGLRGELYNLKEDPQCFQNHWDNPDYTEIRHQLYDTLLDAIAKNYDPLCKKEGPW